MRRCLQILILLFRNGWIVQCCAILWNKKLEFPWKSIKFIESTSIRLGRKLKFQKCANYVTSWCSSNLFAPLIQTHEMSAIHLIEIETGDAMQQNFNEISHISIDWCVAVFGMTNDHRHWLLIDEAISCCQWFPECAIQLQSDIFVASIDIRTVSVSAPSTL